MEKSQGKYIKEMEVKEEHDNMGKTKQEQMIREEKWGTKVKFCWMQI